MRFNNRNTAQRRGESGRVYSTKRMVPLFASVGKTVSDCNRRHFYLGKVKMSACNYCRAIDCEKLNWWSNCFNIFWRTLWYGWSPCSTVLASLIGKEIFHTRFPTITFLSFVNETHCPIPDNGFAYLQSVDEKVSIVRTVVSEFNMKRAGVLYKRKTRRI